MKLVSGFEEARREYRGLVGCVPTMGFLHEGHLSLVEAARQHSETVIVTLFVNPLQFGSESDLSSYPRDLQRDSQLAEKAGADLLFAPPHEEMYPTEPLTTVTVSGIADRLEGAHRPGHFEGVATVVAKLLAGLRPDRTYLGRKDAQQLALVRRLVSDLSFPTEVIGGPTIREPDGLALSSRNIHLNEKDRRKALGLSKALRAAAGAIRDGERDAATLEQLVESVAVSSGLALEYSQLVDAHDVSRVEILDREAFLAVAAPVADTRLIDNLYVHVEDSGRFDPDFGQVLDGPSVLYEGR